MKVRNIITLLYVLSGLTYLSGCGDDDDGCGNVPTTPEIEFLELKEFQRFDLFLQTNLDSINLKIRFIGIKEKEKNMLL